MRFLANENFPGDAVTALRSAGHDVAWLRTEAPGSKDEDILARAERENRVLLTFDKDFGELCLACWTAGIVWRGAVPAADAAGWRGWCYSQSQAQ